MKNKEEIDLTTFPISAKEGFIMPSASAIISSSLSMYRHSGISDYELACYIETHLSLYLWKNNQHLVTDVGTENSEFRLLLKDYKNND